MRGTDDRARAALRGALEGDREALEGLVEALTPVIQARVARALLRRRGSANGRDVRQEIEDLTQEVFLALFAKDAKVLRAWSPERGASLLNFVGLVAEREVASVLRSGRRSPWTEDPTLDEGLERASAVSEGPEPAVQSRELLEALLDGLRARLSPKGLGLFHRLFVDQGTVEEVSAETGMTADALYAWRSRLGRVVRELAAELMSEDRPSQRRSGRG